MSNKNVAERDVDDLARSIAGGDRVALARGITLVESRRPGDRLQAERLIELLLPRTGRALRVGLSGVPGVGKSTLIERLGCQLVDDGHRVAVLAVDPSSTVSGGSILGDKARMNRLAQRPGAFIRPSPSAANLGGVTRRTREALHLCEAAGFDTVLVETVGVGQSETAVRDLVDTFVLLLLPGAGDELQGIKKGIVELADVVAVNKADGDGAQRAKTAQSEVEAALTYQRMRPDRWSVPTLLVSGLTGDGLDRLWAAIVAHRANLEATGQLERRRGEQRATWFADEVDERLRAAFWAQPDVAKKWPAMHARVRAGEISVGAAAREILGLFLGGRP